jgi:hypothetical protein
MEQTNVVEVQEDVLPSERRQSRRRKALKSALVVFKNGYCDIKCRILDFSESGALLQPADVVQVPNQFLLKPSMAPSRECEVVWRGRTTIGVRYCS